MNTATRYATQSVVGLAMVVVVVVLGYTDHLSSATTYTLFLALIGALGASGLWTLASNKPNADAIPHLIIGLALLGALLALALHDVFTDTETQAAFALLLVGSATTTGYVAGASTTPTDLAVTPPIMVPSATPPP